MPAAGTRVADRQTPGIQASSPASGSVTTGQVFLRGAAIRAS